MNSTTLNLNPLSAQTISLLAAANLTPLGIIKMNNIDSLDIKGIAGKRLAQLRMFRLMNAVSNLTDEFDARDVAEIRKHFTNQDVADFLSHKKTYKYFKAIHAEFLSSDKLDTKIARCLCMFKGQDLATKRVGQLAKALPRYTYIGEFSNYHIEEAYLALAGTLLNGLKELNAIDEVMEPKWEVIKGRRIQRFEEHLKFSGEQTFEKDPYKGISEEPELLLSSKIKTKIGGKARKYSGKEKAFLKGLSSIPLQLVVIPREEFISYIKAEKWYTSALENKIESETLLNIRVEELADVYESLQGRNHHLSMRFDYRTRMYYDFINVTLSPSTKAGKYFWENVEEEYQIQESLELHIWSAVKLTGKRVSIAQANKLFNTSPKKFHALLNDTEGKHFSDVLYERRLSKAIMDITAHKPTRFLLAQDATNGGLQRFACEFKELKSLKAANLAGNKVPQDSHQYIADAAGVGRKLAKDTVSQAAFHGAQYLSIAKSISLVAEKEFSETEAENFMVEAFGQAITNIPLFNAFGSKLYDQFNTSLFFTTMDGMRAQTIAYHEKVSIKVWSLAMSSDTLVKSRAMVKDMPLHMTATGKVIDANAKMHGTYANTTHSIDAPGMRYMMAPLVKIHASSVFVHDNVLCSGNHHINLVRPALLQSFIDQAADNTYVRSLSEMAENREGQIHKLPKFLYGTGTDKMIFDSNVFMGA